MTPSDLTELSPLQAAAQALDEAGYNGWQPYQCRDFAKELRAAERATTPSFEEWLCREMPPNTVIADPKWWASRIERAVLRAQTINGAATGVEHGSHVKAFAEGHEPQQDAAPPSASTEPIGYINEMGEAIIEKMSVERAHFLSFSCGHTMIYTYPPEANALLRECEQVLDDGTKTNVRAVMWFSGAMVLRDRIRAYLARAK